MDRKSITLSGMWRVRTWLLGGFLWALALPLAAAESGRLKVLTSISPLYSWAVNVAGDHADVENLLPADVGPHDYEYRPRDLRKIKAADVIFLNGLDLESSLARTIAANDPTATKKIIEASAGISTNLLIYDLPVLHVESDATEPHHHHGPANPHIWLDPEFARHAITNFLIALQQADPVNAAAYATNATRYLGQLDTLDRELRATLETLPHRDLVTFHDAFPYFCRRYGLNLAGVIEEVPGASPSPRYLADLSAIVRNQKVRVLFTEPQFDPRLARQLARDLQVSIAPLDTLETGRLSPTAYEDGMRSNLRVLKTSLK